MTSAWSKSWTLVKWQFFCIEKAVHPNSSFQGSESVEENRKINTSWDQWLHIATIIYQSWCSRAGWGFAGTFLLRRVHDRKWEYEHDPWPHLVNWKRMARSLWSSMYLMSPSWLPSRDLWLFSPNVVLKEIHLEWDFTWILTWLKDRK